ncbi:MAG: HsmA family protein [Anaerolineaceae bacterium]|nr:HsmA family protein [Anaerolineaceae bacterium]
MSQILIIAIVCMISALVFYSIGVWSERFAGKLKPWHVLFFLGGFIFDTTGTTLMGRMAGKMELDFHGITGALAIALMFSHAVWAVVVLIMKKEKVIANFHKFSMAVWILWLVPFMSGAAGAMIR